MVEHKLCYPLQQDRRNVEKSVYVRSILVAAALTPIRYGRYGCLYHHTVHPDTLQRRDLHQWSKVNK